MVDFLRYGFLQNALIAGLLSSILSGIIGFIIVEKKMIMMSGGIAHASYGGVGLGYLLGIEPIFGALGFSIFSALSVGLIKRKGLVDSDIVIGLFWSLGMALGVVFVSLVPGYPPDLSSYLFGNILAVTRMDLFLMSSVVISVVAVFLAFYNNWKAFLFDEEFAEIRGAGVVILEFILLLMVALSVVVLIRVVGIVLTLAILIAPAAASRLIFKRISSRIFMSVLFGIFFMITGLMLSYVIGIASGAVIVIIAVGFYLVVYLLAGVFRKRA